MTILGTRRLRLEPFDPAHLDGLSAMNSDPEVMRYIGPPESREQTLEVIHRIQARWVQTGYSWWSLIERDSGQLVGAGCVQNLRRSGDAPDPSCPLEIGWRLRREYWGRGLASEAAMAMAGFAFQALGAEILLAVCNPENTASAAVMTRLGMQYRGIERWYDKPLATYELTADRWLRTAAGSRGT